MNDSASKYLFNQTFNVNEEGFAVDDEGPALIFSDADITAAQATAKQQGFSEGYAQAKQEIESTVERLLTSIGAQLTDLGSANNSALTQNRADAAKLALAIGDKLASELLQRQPIVEIENMISHCLQILPLETRLRVIVNDALTTPVEARLSAHLADIGFAGDVTVVGDAKIPAESCQISWANGGAVLDFEGAKQEIAQVIERYCQLQFDNAQLPEKPTDLNAAPQIDALDTTIDTTMPNPQDEISERPPEAEAVGDKLDDFGQP
jgi:flagellar assembly protein FliH